VSDFVLTNDYLLVKLAKYS